MSKKANIVDCQDKTYKTIRKNILEVAALDNQIAIHKKTGIPQSTLSKQLEGDSTISLSTLIAVADGYNVPLSKLVDRKEDLTKYTSLEDAAKALFIIDRILGIEIQVDGTRPVVRMQHEKYDYLFSVFQKYKEIGCLDVMMNDWINWLPFLEHAAEVYD